MGFMNAKNVLQIQLKAPPTPSQTNGGVSCARAPRKWKKLSPSRTTPKTSNKGQCKKVWNGNATMRSAHPHGPASPNWTACRSQHLEMPHKQTPPSKIPRSSEPSQQDAAAGIERNSRVKNGQKRPQGKRIRSKSNRELHKDGIARINESRNVDC